MLGIIKEINGQKKIIPLTTDTGTGASVGTLIQQYKKVPMSGLAENQQDNVLNDVKEYIRKSNELSPIESFTLTTTNQTAQYDGFLFVYMVGNSDIETQIYVNDEQLFITQTPAGFDSSITIPLCKGDTIRVNRIGGGIYWTKARWYKNR